MNKEQAIKELNEIRELVEEDLKYKDYEVIATLDQIDLKALIIVLDLLEKQQKELDNNTERINELINEVTLKQCELDKKDKRIKRQFKIIKKRDKQIEELKQIAHNDFEERCRLTFKLEELENELDKKDKIINDMAEHIEKGCDFDNRIKTKEQIIDYFTNKYEEGKGE